MMHAVCITGANQISRQEKISEELTIAGISTFDTVELIPSDEKEHIGIADVRVFTARLLLSPDTSPYTAGIIRNAHLLTIEAQNALLKILEEPPSRAVIFMETASCDLLLPTIISRCQCIQLVQDTSESEDSVMSSRFQSLIEGKPSLILAQISEIATDRLAAKQFTDQAILYARKQLHSAVSGSHTAPQLSLLIRCIRNLEKARKELEANVNPKSVLDSVFLNLSG